MMRSILILLILCGAGVPPVNVSATQPHGQDAHATGVIRLRVRVGIGDGSKARGLSRKRFFLLKGSLNDNKELIDSLQRQAVLSRECYYRSVGASEAFIAWLIENDCESVYCREVESKDVSAVPEFAHALAVGEKEYGSSELARKWLTVNLPDNIRSGFYKRQQQDLDAQIQVAEQSSSSKLMSVMTDRNGTAYFTDVAPGTYVISNIIATLMEKSSEVWTCEVKVSAGDLATATREKPFLITDPNNKDLRDKKNIKCVSIERPLQTCPRN